MSTNLSNLLATTRVEFLRAFVDAAQKIVPRCIEDLFKKADSSYSSSEQGRFLNARSALLEQGDFFVRQMNKNMESLLTRSFQTTYNTFRPNLGANFNAENLSLVDSSAFEDELRIDNITKQFRNEAEEQLRDLNIRIAIIFEQDTTKERENPFRPYLFSRCIASSVNDFKLHTDLSNCLIEELSAHFTDYVPVIYDAVNQHLAKNGIAAQLQLKIKKSPAQATVDTAREAMEEDVEDPYAKLHTPAPMGQRGGQSFNQSSTGEHYPHRHGEHARYGIDPADETLSRRALSTDQPRGQIEQLFQTVRGMASGIAGKVADVAQNLQNGFKQSDSAGMASGNLARPAQAPSGASKQFGWLPSGQAVGGVLRQFFGQTDSQQQQNQYAEFANSTLGGRQRSAFAQESPRYDGAATYTGSYDEHPSAIVRSVHGMQKAFTPQAEEMWDNAGVVRNLILEQRDALGEMTDDIDEQMTIDIVAMLFEFILRDNQVPAEVRAQLGRLQFLVLKIALKDNLLLTQKNHPARLLVNRIGSISLGLKQIDPSGVHITAEICRIVETLLHDENESPLLFAKMLDEFDIFIAQELRAGDKEVERTVEVIERAENRTLRLAHISARLEEALQGLTIDTYLCEFLENIWVHAIELADRDDAKRGQRYRLFIPDILWSIVPKFKEDDRAQLLALLPIILGTLREGLKSIDYNAQLQQNLMNWLVDAHTSALRASHAATLPAVPSLSAIHAHFKKFIDNPEEAPKKQNFNESLADVRAFLDQAIKELDLNVQILDRVFDQELPAEVAEQSTLLRSGDLSPEVIQERLKSGVGLEINLGGAPSLGKLNWINPNLKNLVLTLDGQEHPSIVSVRMFRRMIAHGRVRFLESEPLFERAVQSLLKSADTVDQAVLA